MKVTKRQLRLLIKEARAPGEISILTEAELNEIAPVISAMFRGLGSMGAKAMANMAQKGISAASAFIRKNPAVTEKLVGLVMQSADKLPGIKKMLKDMGKDVAPADIALALQNPPKEAVADLDKMLKGAGKELAKAEECECPDPAEEKGILSKLGSFFK
jgi:hypothetical protein